MTKEKKNRLAYAWLWIWLLIVTAVAACFYIELIDSAEAIISDVPILCNVLEVRGKSWITIPLKYVVGSLLCWRAVKVLVLHGAPLSLGMQITSGRQDNGSGGRMVTLAWIGDENISEDNPGEFWFVVVFRAHPTSDKLMRTRLELLTAALPFGRSFVINESRIFLAKRHHQQRKNILEFAMNKYLPKSHTKSSFESELLRGMKAVVDSLKQISKVYTADNAVKEVQGSGNERES